MTDSIFSYPTVVAVIAGILLLGIVGKLLKFSFERIAKWYLYASVFASLIVMDSIFFPFIGGKDYFFRFTVELALIAFVLWWAFEARPGQVKKMLSDAYKKPIVIAVTVFVAMVLLACAFGYDAYGAFWSNFERGEGGFQMIHYYIFFMLLTLLFTEESDWKNLFKFSLVSAVGMILYGIGGNYSLSGFIGPYSGSTAPTGWFHELIDGRFQGSLGNPAYVAPYLIFSMFYAAYLWVGAKIKGAATALVSWGYGILIAVFLIFFVLSQTRGAFIGLGVGVLAMLLYWIVFSPQKVLRKWSAIALIVLALVGVGLYAVRNTSFVENLPEGRLLQISTSDSTAQTRFWVWGEAWQGFLERPILGWGPENFTPVFDKFFNPNFYIPGQNTETWFDRAHSIYFDYLVETGILGLLSYLAIFFFFFYWEFFKKKAKHHVEQGATHAWELQKGLMIALPVAYLVQGVAIFDVFPMYINLFLFFGFAAYYFTTHKQS